MTLLWASGLPAQADALTQRLLESVQTNRLLSILATEAIESGSDVDRDFLNGEGGDFFRETVTRLNDPKRLAPKLEAIYTESMTETQRDSVALFFESDLGQRIIDLELSAREAMIDAEVEAAVKERVAGSGVPPLVQQLIDESRLVERNTEDSLGIVKEFFLGIRSAGQDELTPGQIDAIVEESRAEVEADTREWLGAFLTLSYSPLSDDELSTYLEFWRTDAGRAFDEALFAAFRQIIGENSFAVGQLVGRLQLSQDI
jgi:hypothetical protein